MPLATVTSAAYVVTKLGISVHLLQRSSINEGIVNHSYRSRGILIPTVCHIRTYAWTLQSEQLVLNLIHKTKNH